ncbi:MAG: transposase [Thermoleophilia bacterium]
MPIWSCASLGRLTGSWTIRRLWSGDRLTAHRAKVVKEFMGASPRLDNFFLPPYAPELNPVEYLWSYLKTNSLANFAAFELNVLADATRKSGRSLQRKEYLLRSFINHSPLSLRLK